jgi:ATP-binding cassette subfamily B multidrug efflux pump
MMRHFMAEKTPSPVFRVRLGPAGGRMVLASVLLTLIATLFSLALPRYLGYIIDELMAGGVDHRTLFQMAGIYFGAALVGAFFSKAMRQVPMRLGPKISHLLRSDLYAHLLRLDDDQVRRHRTGDLMARLGSDVNAVAEMISLGGHSVIRAVFTLGFAFWVMFTRSPSLARIMAVLLPLMILIGFLLLRSIRKRHLGVQEKLSELTTYCQETFQGIRVIKGMGIESLRTDAFKKINETFIGRNMALNRIEVPAWPLMHAGFILGNAALLWIGGQQVIRGELSLGVLVEFQQYLMVLQWPTLSLAWTLSLILRGRASLSRLREVTREQPSLTDGDQTEHETDLSSGGIAFEQVTFSLDGHTLLHDINFSTAHGQLLGITGPTGAGKTMLLNLLLRRFDPDRGTVRVGGSDVRTVPAETLYRFLRVAPQEPVLFSMTLAENLRLAKPDATPEELEEVLRLSALDSDLRELPDGLETRIGERGVTLSGGQRQRCAIARALLGAPELMVLDDSLSAVDTATEALILRNLLPFMRQRTGILVSHRHATLRQCDRVLVLRNGRVEQFGTPEELEAQPGYFAEQAERQRLREELEALNV